MRGRMRRLRLYVPNGNESLNLVKDKYGCVCVFAKSRSVRSEVSELK